MVWVFNFASWRCILGVSKKNRNVSGKCAFVWKIISTPKKVGKSIRSEKVESSRLSPITDSVKNQYRMRNVIFNESQMR